jgi:hypothetical protein
MAMLSRRLQLAAVVFGYIIVLIYATYLYYGRHLAELRDPQSAAGGMWAFGDLLLNLFVFLLFLVPTFFLLRLLAQSGPVFAAYSKIALLVSLTAPLCGLALVIYKSRPLALENLCVTRLFYAPFVLLILGLSRFLGRRQPAKRLVSYALAIEGFTFLALVVVMFATMGAHQ